MQPKKPLTRLQKKPAKPSPQQKGIGGLPGTATLQPAPNSLLRQAQLAPASISPAGALLLQRAIGNRAVGRLLDMENKPSCNKVSEVSNLSQASLQRILNRASDIIAPARDNSHLPPQPAAEGVSALETPDSNLMTALSPVIQRKLGGSRKALEAVGGDPSRKSKGKAIIAKAKPGSTTGEGSGKYAQIFWDLNSYEKAEAKLLKTRRPLSVKKRQKMLNQLENLVSLAEGWLRQNQEHAQDPKTVSQLLKGGKSADQLEEAESADQRRFHGIKLLLVRLRHEHREISEGKFHETLVWSDETLDTGATKDDAFGGAVNRLDKVGHKGVEKEGVFIWDRSWDDSGTSGKDLGIPDVDPMAGARSVAMYQLAKLLDFDIDVIARTEFATHKSATKKQGQPMPEAVSKFGIRMEMAEGREAAKTPTAQTAAERGEGEISLEDPILQRALNALQLIDAIAGQLDRHWHNYYIATDRNGSVTGVVGIDLDMAFAMDHRDVEPVPVDSRGVKVTKANFVGMPELVDKKFAQAIIGLKEETLKTVLETYLAPEEVESTLVRFRLVKETCTRIQGTDKIVPDWNAVTAKRQQDPATSYLGKMQEGVIGQKFAEPAAATLRALFDDNGIGQDKSTRKEIPSLVDSLVNRMKDGQLTVQQGNQLIQTVQRLFAESRSIQAAIERLRTLVAAGKEKAMPIKQQLAELKKEKETATGAIDSQLKSMIRELGDEAALKDQRFMALNEEKSRTGTQFNQRLSELQTLVNQAEEGDPEFLVRLREALVKWLQNIAKRLAMRPVNEWAGVRPLPLAPLNQKKG